MAETSLSGKKRLTDGDLATLTGLCKWLASKWEAIGDRLGVPVGQLDAIRENNRGGGRDMCQRCLRDMLLWRLRNGKGVTAERLAKAVHDLGEHNTEANINKQFGISQQETISPHQTLPQFNLPPCVVRFINDTKARYVQQPILPDSDWPPSLGGKYIKLALIRQERQLLNYTYESVVEQQIDYTRGDYDKIMEYKTEIELIKAFDEVDTLCESGKAIVLKMLIDGAPGVGKTTLSRKVSRMWANGKILQRYWLVLLLHLREKVVSKAKTIDELFYHDDSDLQQSVVKCVKERSGDGILIIFDGFDELSSFERSEKSLFLDICRGKVLLKCAVAVTSRPYASRSLQKLPLINRHIEVLGFTEEQVKECIRHKIKNTEKAEELCVELKDRLDIASICQIPLNCSIMLYVYEQEKYRLPHTLTELYELFILHSLKRFLCRTENDLAADRLLGLDKLLGPCKEHFLSLCKLALKGLEKDKLVFSRQDVEVVFQPVYHESGVDLPVLDLMTSAKSYSRRGTQDTYNFLHLTIQEFLAAYHLAHRSSDADKLSFFKENLMENRFRMVLLFLSGLTSLKFPNVSSVFSKESWIKDQVHICHLTYEAQNHSLCKDISENCCLSPDDTRSIDIEMYTSSSFDKLVMLSFVAYSNSQWKYIRIHPDDPRIVYKVFSSEQLNFNTVIEKVCVAFGTEKRNKMSEEDYFADMAALRYLDELPQVKRVSVNVSISGKTDKLSKRLDPLLIKNMSDIFTGPKAIKNKDYSICFYSPNPKGEMHFGKIIARLCETLGKCLFQNPHITEVTLDNVTPSDVTKYILTTLSEKNSNSYLKHLKCIRRHGQKLRCDLSFRDFCTTLAVFISCNTFLKELDLDLFSRTDIDKSGIDIVMSALQCNTTLQKVYLVRQTIFEVGRLRYFIVLFERNQDTGVMELKCTQNCKERFSLTPAVILPLSYVRKRQNTSRSPPLQENGPPAKQPRTDSSPQSAIGSGGTQTTCLQVVSPNYHLNSDVPSVSSTSPSPSVEHCPGRECSSTVASQSLIHVPSRGVIATACQPSNSIQTHNSAASHDLQPALAPQLLRNESWPLPNQRQIQEPTQSHNAECWPSKSPYGLHPSSFVPHSHNVAAGGVGGRMSHVIPEPAGPNSVMPTAGVPHALPPMWPTPMPFYYPYVPLPPGMLPGIPPGHPHQAMMMPRPFHHGMQPPYQQQMPVNPYPVYPPSQPSVQPNYPHPMPWSHPNLATQPPQHTTTSSQSVSSPGATFITTH